MTDDQDITLEAEVSDEDAEKNIAKAVRGRRAIARGYVRWVRRRHPDATPAEVIQLLERHYASSITAAGAAITVGTIAADVGIAMIPGVGAAAAGAKSASQQVAKKAGKEAAKAVAKKAGKDLALGAAKGGAKRAAALLPAGDEQLQFEITALFALAIADIHGLEYDHDQAQALVYGITNERVSQQQIATMASDLARTSTDADASVGKSIAAGKGDWSHWASTLADTLPGGAAQSLVRTIQTGQLETVRETLTGKQQSTIEYGVGALTGGVARFVFGRDVILSTRSAFPEPPQEFPDHLAVAAKDEQDLRDGEPNRALAALEQAANRTGARVVEAAGVVGGGVATGAAAVGSGVSKAAGTVARQFRSVDLDGDGVPDEPQALTAVKGAGGAIVGAASSAGGSISGLFRRKRSDRAEQADPADADGIELADPS
ncbi:hypothetical protein [Curtobacterium sp. MCBD17_028]|uniref:hypothetical protein n=1 Tax=Curtobacterium sp. MCBD17_028 TaxID=2175670 RepID=UPI000DA772A4|nr:hypothetical protein [Curtobacterium sp. MCBD17_028]PZE30110.1 hypothetical protein DEI86_02290 [Curtobacterium sp. MCBD17_028]